MDYEEAVRQANELIQGAIPTITRNFAAPTYEKVDTKILEAENLRLQGQRDAANFNIGVETLRVNEATETEKTAIRARGAAEADLERANAERAAQVAGVAAEIMKGMGISPQDVIAVTQRIRENTPIAEAKLREIQSLQATGPFDNPIEWLGNQLQLPSKVKSYNTEANIINSWQDQVNGFLDTAEKTRAFADRAIPTITAAQAKAASEVKLQAAAKEAAIADATLARTNVDFAKARLANDLAVAGQTLHTTQLQIHQNTEELRARLQAIAMADSHANRMINAARLLETIYKNEDELAQRKQIGVILKNYDRVMGMPDGTTNFQMWRSLGDAQRNNIIALGVGSAGSGPFSGMLTYMRQGPGPFVSPETKAFMDHVYTIGSGVAVRTDVQMLDEKQKIYKIDSEVKKALDDQIKNASSPGNIFRELSPKRMLESAQVKIDSAVGKVIEPLTKREGDVETDVVVQAIASAFKNPTDAGQAIADYYGRNMLIRNGAIPTSLVNIKLPTEYKVKARIGAFTTIMYDLTKPADATQYLLFQEKIKKQESRPWPGSGIGGFS